MSKKSEKGFKILSSEIIVNQVFGLIMDINNPVGIIELSNSYNVSFKIIGTHAVNFHGYVRATEDVDVLFL